MKKIVVLENGQQLIAKVSVITREDSGERVGYLLEQPKIIFYYQDEEDVKVKLLPFVAAAINSSYEVRVDSVLSFGDPHPTLEENYDSLLSETEETSEVQLELSEESEEETESDENE